MKNNGFKLIILTLISALVMSMFMPMNALAAKKKKKLTDAEKTQITSTIANLKRKVYASSLFSPKDNDALINTKMTLDEAMEGKPTPEFAGWYYNLGYVFKAREYPDDAADCYQTILDSFPDSPYAARAMSELKKMGVKIVAPGK